MRIKKIDLPARVSDSVYRRMRAERERVARDFRSKGAEAAERIRADADRQRSIILAEAYRDSEVVRGEGDAKATDIYAEAFSKNEDFFRFNRSINAYKNNFSTAGDIILLEPSKDDVRMFMYNIMRYSARVTIAEHVGFVSMLIGVLILYLTR